MLILAHCAHGEIACSPVKHSQRATPLTSYQFSRLHTFECVARHLSFALAAQELSITPSAVSHRINLLEKELGFLLFQRFHRRITLTPEGERMQWALDSSFNTLNREILTSRIAS